MGGFAAHTRRKRGIAGQYGFSTVSMEALPRISADTHFFYVVQSNDDAFQTSAVKPLWDNLPFVKAGRPHALGGDTWLFGGPLSAEVLVDIVVKTLAADTAPAAAGCSSMPWPKLIRFGYRTRTNTD